MTLDIYQDLNVTNSERLFGNPEIDGGGTDKVMDTE